MTSTILFFEKLLGQGEAILVEKPVIGTADCAAVVELLEHAFDDWRLEIAGPPLAFEPATALAAAQFVGLACWHLVERDDEPLLFDSRIEPTSASAQLSADLCLRFLPAIHRRTRIRPPDDPLQRALVDILRRWPLSGAAAEIHEDPLTDLMFNDHSGLQMLYAERLALQPRANWIPPTGRTREVVELVFQQQGKSMPVTAEGVVS